MKLTAKLAALLGLVSALLALPVLGADAAGTHARGAAATQAMQGMDMSGMKMTGMDMKGMNMQATRQVGASSHVTISLRKWGIKASAPAVKAGAVTLQFHNTSSIRHRIAILRSTAQAGKLPVKAGRPVVKHAVAYATIAPHASAKVTVQLHAGRYLLVCTLRGHYLHGMMTTLTARAPAAPGATVLDLGTSGMIKFNRTTLQAPAGKITLQMTNTVALGHNIALRGPGVSLKGQVVEQGGVSTISATLKRGTYSFYCSVPGHEQAGMKGTLIVTAAAAGAQPPTTGQPGDAGAPVPAAPPTGPAPATPAGAIVLHTASQIGFSATSLTAPSGPVTLSLVNDSALGHNIAIRGNGVDVAGPVVGTGSVSSVSATLAPGIYTFYCSVSGHAAAGMTGTLVVVVPGSTAPTGALPPPSGVNATAIGAAGLTLGWSASPDPLAISYELQRGTTVLGTTPSTTFPVSALTCNTAYTFSVIALDASGRRSTAAMTTATTAACAPGPPPPPGGGTVLDLSTSGQIGFTTHALTAPAGQVTIRLTNVSGLDHNIALQGNGVALVGAVVPSGISSVTGTLAAGIYTFYCSLPGHAGAGMSGTLTVTGAGTTPPPAGALPPPSGVKASAIGAAGLTLGWTASPDPLAIGYEVQLGTTVLGTTPSTTFPVSTLACNTAYTFSVIALDTSGRRSTAATTTATTAACAPGPPPPPGGGTVLDLSTSGQIGFTTHALTAPAGQVTIRLTNVSGLDHNIALKGNGVALVGSVVRSGVSSVTGTLAAGIYTFYCTLSGHAGAGMSGTLTVTGTGTTPPPPPAAGAGLNLTVTGAGTFNTTTLTAPLGTVTVVLDNESSVARTLRVNGHGKDFTSAVVAPGASVSLTMTFDKPDDFDFSAPAGRNGDGGTRGTLYIT